MAATGRNQRCLCGSGRKVKRCCGERRGPGERDLARAFLATLAPPSALVLIRCPRAELRRLHDEMVELPERHTSLQLRLPRLMTPQLERLMDAIDDDDVDEMDAALPAVLDRLDTPVARAHLARAVIRLRDDGEIDAKVAACTLVDLSAPSLRAFISAAVLCATAVATGQLRTPSGLVVASRV
ncbi:MAG: SEC-C metal-binding domain-containing protein [Acidimicrobiales bacterium]